MLKSNNFIDFNNLKPKLHFQRFEFKYLIPNELIEPIRKELLQYMEYDSFAETKPDKKYRVTSLYYDTPHLDNYYQKMAGIKDRRKQRVRVYGENPEDNPEVYIEIKRRHDAVVVKDRIIARSDNYSDFINNRVDINEASSYSQNDKNVLGEFLFGKLRGQMQPVVLVVYDREPMFSRHDHRLRVTFDSNIEAYRAKGVYKKTGRCYRVLTNQTVMEIKFNNFMPFWLYNIIQKYHLQRIAFSKYCNAVDACGLS